MKWEMCKVSQEETRAGVRTGILLCRLWLLLPVYNLFLTQASFGKPQPRKHSGNLRTVGNNYKLYWDRGFNSFMINFSCGLLNIDIEL
jgi:hypothetical protein